MRIKVAALCEPVCCIKGKVKRVGKQVRTSASVASNRPFRWAVSGLNIVFVSQINK